jgi:hypothetical protein
MVTLRIHNIDLGSIIGLDFCTGNIGSWIASKSLNQIVAFLTSAPVWFGPEDWLWAGSGKE